MTQAQSLVNKYIQLLNTREYHYHAIFLEYVYKIKDIIETLDRQYIDLVQINPVVDPLVSVVMTCHNRSQQTYYTLYTISLSKVKSRVQVIIVDDSDGDYLESSQMAKYGVSISWVRLRNKFWINPCVNYNIGFQFIKASRTIIQNPEICHIGDICHFISGALGPDDNRYYVFDVANLPNSETNTKFWNVVPSYEHFDQLNGMFEMWYQQTHGRNLQYHFLTAIRTDSLRQIKGFDMDYAFGVAYDDDELIFKIRRNKIGIQICNIPHESRLMGVHQWHPRSETTWGHGKMLNNKLFEAKAKYFDAHSKFVYLTDYSLDEAYQKLFELIQLTV